MYNIKWGEFKYKPFIRIVGYVFNALNVFNA